MSRWHAVIVGSGPAGAATAITLARAGARVLLVEREREPVCAIGEGLPPAARPLLQDLGVWQEFLTDGHMPSHGNASIWGGPAPRYTDFIRSPNGHGWHLDRPRFDARLRRAALEAGCTLSLETRPTELERTSEGWRIGLGDGRVLEAEWLVEATGRTRAVARKLAIGEVAYDQLVAIFAAFISRSDGDRDTLTWVEAAPDGWWYSARLPEGRRMVAYLSDADLLERPRMDTEQRFLERLADAPHIGGQLSRHGYTMRGHPSGRGAESSRMTRVLGDGWLAVGDAALAFDPISSQGILTALYSAREAAEVVLGVRQPAAYAARAEDIWRAYVDNLANAYRAEPRWLARTFWRRRRRSPAATAQSASRS